MTPLIDLRFFKDSGFSAASAAAFMFGAALFGSMFLLPLYYQEVRGGDALRAGLLLAPQGLGTAVAMLGVGRVIDRVGPRWIVPPGMVLAILGTLAYTQVGAGTNEAWLGFALFIRGAGLGTTTAPVMATVYRSVERAAVPRAASALNSLVQLGGSLGTAVFALVLTTRTTTLLGQACAGRSGAGGCRVVEVRRPWRPGCGRAGSARGSGAWRG